MNEQHPFDAPHTVDVNKRKTGVRWWLIISIFGAPFLLIAFGLFVFRVGYTLRELSGRRAMEVELQKLVSDEYPIDDNSIDELYRSRTSADHTVEWLALFAIVESAEFKESCAGVPALDRTVDDEAPFHAVVSQEWEYADVCSTFTADSEELIEQIRVLAAAPTPTHFPIYFQSNATLLPEVQGVRQLSTIVFVDAQEAIHVRDSDRAMQDILTLYYLANHVDAVPCLVAHLVGTANRRQALQVLQTCVEHDLLQDDQLLQIDAMLEIYCDIGSRWQTFIGEELALSLPAFANPAIVMERSGTLPARGHDAVFYIGLMRRAMKLGTEDWSSFYSAALELEAEVSSSSETFLQSTDRILSHVFAPSFGSSW